MKSSLELFLPKLSQQKIMIVGDMIADSYLYGQIDRVSREAPVLVLQYEKEVVVPGGAANVVHNAAVLGAQVWAAGLVGADEPGNRLYDRLIRAGVREECLVRAGRPSIAKTRILAGGQATVRQQVVRIDRGTTLSLTPEEEERLTTSLRQYLPACGAVILSDYGCGTLTPEICRGVLELCRQEQIPCLVDSRHKVQSFAGADFIKQNEAEAAAALGVNRIPEEKLEEMGFALRAKLGAKALLLTRGEKGLSLFEENGCHTAVPVTNKSEVYDVSGAGDTMLAISALALAAGANYGQAARLANIAAGVVVRKFGTAVITPQELEQAVRQYE